MDEADGASEFEKASSAGQRMSAADPVAMALG